MLGAHREAAAHYLTALKHTEVDDVETRAMLLENHSYESFLIDRMDEAMASREMAFELRQRQTNPLRAGDNLRWLSRLAWFRGSGEKSRKLAREAIAILERLPPGSELAMAYSNMSQLCMLSEDGWEAVQWGERALDLAERFGLTEILAHALNNIGQAEVLMGKPEGAAKVKRSLDLALAHDMHEHASRAYTSLIYHALVARDYASTEERLAAGLAYTREREIDAATLYKRAMRARAHLEQGRWKEASDDAAGVLRGSLWVARVVAIVVLGTVRLRQGESDFQAFFD